jgi:molecular chaperone GrpE
MEEKDLNQAQEEDPGQPEKNESSAQPAESQSGEIERQVEYYRDLFLRKAAEFDNYKRRTEIETAAIIRYANEDLIAAILPVVDDLERSLKNSKDQKDSAFFRGIELIHQKMTRILESQGVRTFGSVGKEFDVHFHDALLQIQKEGVPAHTIIEEVEKGYMFHDKVLRHAKVVVAADGDAGQQAVDTGDDARKKGDQK